MRPQQKRWGRRPIGQGLHLSDLWCEPLIGAGVTGWAQRQLTLLKRSVVRANYQCSDTWLGAAPAHTIKLSKKSCSLKAQEEHWGRRPISHDRHLGVLWHDRLDVGGGGGGGVLSAMTVLSTVMPRYRTCRMVTPWYQINRYPTRAISIRWHSASGACCIR